MTVSRLALKGTTKAFDCPKCGSHFVNQSALASRLSHRKCCSPEERFWFKVNKTEGCWLWTGFLNHDGYGRVGPRKGVHTGMRAHKMAWELANGPVPDGLYVMHTCDVRSCVRPDHLRIGTQKDNMADCKAKGRYVVGEDMYCAKITADDVVTIRALKGQQTQAQLAERFGLSTSYIWQIQNRRTWKHVK